jgi:hypothetical protein
MRLFLSSIFINFHQILCIFTLSRTMAFLCSLQNAGGGGGGGGRGRMPATVRNNEFFPSPKLTARKRIRRELNRCKKEEKREGVRERERERERERN